MRIVCPNCDAQYEVPAAVIPAEGRDVECSNCGKTWYQHHPDHLPEDTAQAVPEADMSTQNAGVADTPSGEEQTLVSDMPVAHAPPQRREIDPNVADILRQEAARERAVRDAESLEVQTDLNLDPVEPPSPAPAPPPTPAAQPTPPPAAADIRYDANSLREPTSRRELLPDVEEINSTLRSTGDRDVAGDDPSPYAPIKRRRKRSFRRGFVLSVALVSAGALLYVFAPKLSQTAPPLSAGLDSYVATIDAARIWLTVQITDLTDWLEAAAAATRQ